VPVYFTIQPGGANVQGTGARLVYPNYTDETPGTRIEFWRYRPEAGWYVYGKGTVSPDGKQIVPDAGVVIREFNGAMVLAPGPEPPEGPSPGDDGAKAGEPVDLATGLFVFAKTDLALPDVLPLALTRTYRTRDTRSRAFGIGATHAYEMFVVGSRDPWTFIELILPDGGRIRYNRPAGTPAGCCSFDDPRGLRAYGHADAVLQVHDLLERQRLESHPARRDRLHLPGSIQCDDSAEVGRDPDPGSLWERDQPLPRRRHRESAVRPLAQRPLDQTHL
jgi:hypothetical protein